MNYSVKHFVFEGWCSSKSAEIGKVDDPNACCVCVEQQIAECISSLSWTSAVFFAFVPSRIKQEFGSCGDFAR